MKSKLLLLPLVFLACVWQAAAQPDCTFTYTAATSGAQSPATSNLFTSSGGSPGCSSWIIDYWTNTSSATSVQFEGAADAVTGGVHGPTGSYTKLTVSSATGSGANPATGTTQGNMILCCDYYPWVRVNVNTLTSSGAGTLITVRAYGYRTTSALNSGGGGGGGGGITALTQDVTASGSGSVAATVVGLDTVPFCSGFSPTNGQLLKYTTGGSPNPCWTAASGGSGPPASVKVLGSDSGSSFVAATANDLGSVSYVAGAGTAQAQTATLAPAVGSLVAGSTRLCWLPAHANSGAGPTMAVNGLAATTIVKSGGAALVASDLTTTAVACVIYDGTDFELQNPQTASGTGGLDQLTQDVLAGPGSGSQPATVVGINTVPLCAGFSPINGQVLQYTTGLSPNPCYTAAAPASGALVLLEEHTASTSAALNFTSWLNSEYDTYIVEFLYLVPDTGDVSLVLQYSTNGGSSYDTTGGHYGWANSYVGTSAAGQFSSSSDSSITLANAYATGDGNAGGSGSIRIFIPTTSTSPTVSLAETVGFPGGGNNYYRYSSMGVYTPTTAVNAFRLLFSSGNIATGIARVYGLTH